MVNYFKISTRTINFFDHYYRFFGRNKRGCEGIFPISYVDIKVPLKVELDSVSPAGFRVRARYTFIAEAYEDLTIKVSCSFYSKLIEDSLVLIKILTQWNR